MAKILIPRSDSISAKIVEPSDFEELFSSDILNDYVSTGLTLTSGSGLAVNISTGKARVGGLFVENDSSATKSSLTASSTNYIYITLTRDGNSEAESWDFTSNTTGTPPTDSMVIGQAITDGSSVTSTNTTGRILYPLNLTESLKKTSPFASASTGKILYYNGSVWTQLAVGSSGKTLKVSGGVPSWQFDDFNGGGSGNMLYHNGSAWAKLAIGSTGKTLKVSGGQPTWEFDDFNGATSGDILYYNGSAWVKLAKGTDGEILELTSGLPAWEQGRLKSMSTGSTTTLDNGLGSGDAYLNSNYGLIHGFTFPTTAIAYRVTQIEFKVKTAGSSGSIVNPIIYKFNNYNHGIILDHLSDNTASIGTGDSGVVKTISLDNNEVYFGGQTIHIGIIAKEATPTSSKNCILYPSTSGQGYRFSVPSAGFNVTNLMSITETTAQGAYYKITIEPIGSL